MKLKEKLARDATKRFGYPESLLCEGLFLEGFEKAKELFAVKYFNTAMDGYILDEINAIGEENV